MFMFIVGLLLVIGVCVAFYFTWNAPGIPIPVKAAILTLELMIMLGGVGLMQSAFVVGGRHSMRRS